MKVINPNWNGGSNIEGNMSRRTQHIEQQNISDHFLYPGGSQLNPT